MNDIKIAKMAMKPSEMRFCGVDFIIKNNSFFLLAITRMVRNNGILSPIIVISNYSLRDYYAYNCHKKLMDRRRYILKTF